MLNNDTIILFDGVCNLCNSAVNFVIRHDKKNRFRFATLQSETGKELLKKHTLYNTPIDSFVLIESNNAYTRSTAALRICRHLDKFYPFLYFFIVIPPPIRNFIYNFIARNRYKWFGKRNECIIPTEELKSKFLG